MNRRTFLWSLFATAGATTIAVGAKPAEASLLDQIAKTDLELPLADLPAEGAQEAQWVNQCYWTRDRWGRRVRVCRRVRVARPRRCWWRYDRWGRRVRVCN